MNSAARSAQSPSSSADLSSSLPRLASGRAERDGDAALRRRLADRVRVRDLPVDIGAAEHVRQAGWVCR